MNNDSERSCWICFSTESEPSSSAKIWVHPCRCSGDTKWVHETCLLSWIVRKQTESTSTGEPSSVLIYEEGQSNTVFERYLNNGEREETEGSPRFYGVFDILFRSEDRNTFNSSLIKCPQCHTPYRIELKRSNIFISGFMSVVSISRNLTNLVVPFGAVVGTLIIFSSLVIGFGAHSTLLILGQDDIFTQHLRRNSWGKTEIFLLYSVPLYSAAFQLKRYSLSRMMFSTASFFLLPSYISLLNELSEERTSSYFTSDKLALAVSMRERFTFLSVLFFAKQVYHMFHDNILVPWIVGVKSKPSNIDNSSSSNSDTSTPFEDFDLVPVNEESNIESTSGFSIMKSFVYYLMSPMIYSLSGIIFKRVIQSMPATSTFLLNLDNFALAVLGTCSLTISKDLIILFFNRQRRIQRKKMHIRNFEFNQQ